MQSVGFLIFFMATARYQDSVGGGAAGQIRRDVQSGCHLADSLWNLSKLQAKRFSSTYTLQGHLEAQSDDEEAADDAEGETRRKRPRIDKQNVSVGIATRIEVAEWLAALQREENAPGEQQLQIVRLILDRCLLEAREIRGGNINASNDEPVRHMIQGLPGAGKSALIKWIRRAFEEVFGFQHGVHYVCHHSCKKLPLI